jgi:hypothetical protein
MKKILFLISIIFILLSSNRFTFAQTGSDLHNLIFVQGNYLRNLGTFGQVWSQAAGGYLGYGIYFPEHNLLMFRTGFMSHTLRSDEQSGGSLSVLPLQIGGRYYFTNTGAMPFFQFMNGFNIVFENVNLIGEKKDKTLLRYFWQVGTGVTIGLSGSLNIDLSLNYNSAFYDNDKELFHEAGAMMNGFEYSIGLGWGLE